MRFLLIDDHPMVLGAFKRLLLHTYQGAKVEEAANAHEAMSHITQGPWDVIFLDIDLPDRSGLDLLHDLRTIAPGVPILVGSGRPEEEFGERALKGGAMGFLQKASLMEEIVSAIHRVRTGKKIRFAGIRNAPAGEQPETRSPSCTRCAFGPRIRGAAHAGRGSHGVGDCRGD